MTPEQKLWSAIAAALTAIVAAIGIYLGTKPDLPPGTPDLILMRGETSEIRLPGPCPRLTVPDGLSVEVLEFKAVETTRPSFQGARVGKYLDALVPCETGADGVWLDVTGIQSGSYTISSGWTMSRGPSWTVLVLPVDMPERPTVPAYTEIRSRTAWQLSGKPDHVTHEAEAIRKWSAFLRRHRIEPLKSWIQDYPPTDPNQWKEFGATFESIVIKDAIAPPMVMGFVRSPGPTTAQLQSIERALKSGAWPADSFAYAWDEGQPQDFTTMSTRLKYIRSVAPSLKLWVTWEELPIIRDLIDGTIPVLDWFRAPGRQQEYRKPYGGYTSCMAQGNCGGAPAAKPTGTPLMILEAPEIHPRMFPIVVAALGGQKILYYKADKDIANAWKSPFSEGGYMEGLLLYPLAGGDLAASVRLKAWREGMNDIEYAKMLGVDLKEFVKSPFEWNQDPKVLDDLRVKLAKMKGAM